MFLLPPSLLAVPLLAAVLAVIALRLLHMASKAIPPILFFRDSNFNRLILEQCPLLLKPYWPTALWGKSGHIQTILYGKMGRVKSPFPRGDRHAVVLADGATVTFDIFEPVTIDHSKEACMLVVCPGIANSSESVYIRTYVNYAQEKGYHVAVLNHLGALRNVPLTAPRIYTYGSTEEFAAMVDEIIRMFPSLLKVAVGFSMGANIIMKFLGEAPRNQGHFIGAVSCCQGYDILEVVPYAMRWEHLRRLYVWAMTRHQIGLLRCHRGILFGTESQTRYGPFDERKILSTTSLLDIDRHYSHRRAGFKSVEEYYHWASSRYYLCKVHIPVFLLNAFDDPLVPPQVHHIPRQFSEDRDNVIFAVTKHGGHLGYFEGGVVVPNSVTWLDRVIVQYSDALLSVTKSLPKASSDSTMSSCESIAKLQNGQHSSF